MPQMREKEVFAPLEERLESGLLSPPNSYVFNSNDPVMSS